MMDRLIMGAMVVGYCVLLAAIIFFTFGIWFIGAGTFMGWFL